MDFLCGDRWIGHRQTLTHRHRCGLSQCRIVELEGAAYTLLLPTAEQHDPRALDSVSCLTSAVWNGSAPYSTKRQYSSAEMVGFLSVQHFCSKKCLKSMQNTEKSLRIFRFDVMAHPRGASWVSPDSVKLQLHRRTDIPL